MRPVIHCWRMGKTELGLMMILFGLCFSTTGSAARFPNAVEKKIVIQGKNAVAVAKQFGMDTSKSSSLSLRLGRGDAWAVYLLKQDTKEPLSNDNEGSPQRYNKVEFSSSPPSLAISPFWLDLGTRGPYPKPGFYSFSSPFLKANLKSDDPWIQILQILKVQPEWKQGDHPFHRCFASDNGPELCMDVFIARDYTDNVETTGYAVTITVHQIT